MKKNNLKYFGIGLSLSLCVSSFVSNSLVFAQSSNLDNRYKNVYEGKSYNYNTINSKGMLVKWKVKGELKDKIKLNSNEGNNNTITINNIEKSGDAKIEVYFYKKINNKYKLVQKRIDNIVLKKASDNINIQFDKASEAKIKDVFDKLNNNSTMSISDKMALVSSEFLDVNYVANRLVGSSTEQEELVVDVLKLDCFTYLDYLEAFRRSSNEKEFINNLRKVRYVDSKVEYLNRKHFFSDWAYENEIMVTDLVKTDNSLMKIASKDTVSINEGKNGEYIKDLGIRERTISYIPRANVTDDNLKDVLITGDYVGFRREIAGLDVTHVGMIVKKSDGIYVRHASSAKDVKKVVDQKLSDYVNINTGIKGILLFRSNFN